MKDFIKKLFSSEEDKAFEKHINNLRNQISPKNERYLSKSDSVKKLDETNIIVAKGDVIAKRFTCFVAAKQYNSSKYSETFTLYNIIVKDFLTMKNLHWTITDMTNFFTIAKNGNKYKFENELPKEIIIAYFSEYLQDNKLSIEVEKMLKSMLIVTVYSLANEQKVLNSKIERLLNVNDYKLSKTTFLHSPINAFLNNCNEKDKSNWKQLLESCGAEGVKNAPTKIWLKENTLFIKEEIGEQIFAQQMIYFLGKGIEEFKIFASFGSEIFCDLRDTHFFVMKGLLWNCGIAGDKQLQQLMYEYTNHAFKKLSGFGPISHSTGSAALQAFALLPIQEGVPRLMSLQNKVNNKTVLKSIEKYIKEAAKNGGLSADNIEEISIPNYGMSQVGVLVMNFGEVRATTTFLSANKNETTWNNNGKAQASVPTAVGTEFVAELKAYKNTIKEIEQLLPSQRNRLENQYLAPVSWTYKDWFSLYISHPVMGILSQKLIWNFEINGKNQQAIYQNNYFENVDGEPITIDETETKVTLWHPIDFDANYVFKWRNYLINKEIVQTFKQAFREVYIVTDAELNTETYSNRFAAHILRQHQFATLAKLRSWNYTLQGNWDSHNIPTKKLSHWNMTAQFWVEGVDAETSPAGIFNYVSSDQVRFYKGAEQINMADVPSMVFTEIMRDVDMYVGVCSIGNDPNWQNNNGLPRYNTYWQSYSFGDLTEGAKLRKDTLLRLVPRLNIKDVAHIEGNFLLVKGKIRSYKIHLGSGNILMTPNDQYLCIVPDSSKKLDTEKVFLPFDGDSILSIILSKAFLLANDDKIKDATINSQILRHS